MQPEATTAAPDPGDAGAARPAGAPSGWASMQPMVFLLLMFGIFYFLMIRPQQKRQREADAMLKSLRRGDKVRTTGGIRGEIVDLTDTDVTLLIADKVKINVLRSHIGLKVGAESATALAKDAGAKDSNIKDANVKDSSLKEPGKEKA